MGGVFVTVTRSQVTSARHARDVLSSTGAPCDDGVRPASATTAYTTSPTLMRGRFRPPKSVQTRNRARWRLSHSSPYPQDGERWGRCGAASRHVSSRIGRGVCGTSPESAKHSFVPPLVALPTGCFARLLHPRPSPSPCLGVRAGWSAIRENEPVPITDVSTSDVECPPMSSTRPASRDTCELPVGGLTTRRRDNPMPRASGAGCRRTGGTS